MLLAMASACEETSPPTSPAVPSASVSALVEADAPLAEGIPDISGCWRPTRADGILSSGPAFYFYRIESNAFILGKDARTKYLVDRQGNLAEINRDPDKPFYPPGLVISTGSVNTENTAIERRFPGDSSLRIYRRCQLVQSAPPDAPVIFESQRPGQETATPVPTITPLQVNPSNNAPPPIAVDPQGPTAEPTPPAISTPAPTPEPTATATPRPEPTPFGGTPRPVLTPLIVPSQSATPEPTPVPTPVPGPSASPNSTP